MSPGRSGPGRVRQGLERDVARVVAEAVVELLEVVDVEQGEGNQLLLAFGLGLLDAEGLDQAAAVGDLGQLVGMDFLGQTAQFAFQLLDALAQGPWPCRVPASGGFVSADQALHAAALFDHLAHRACQAFQ